MATSWVQKNAAISAVGVAPSLVASSAVQAIMVRDSDVEAMKKRTRESGKEREEEQGQGGAVKGGRRAELN
eukprot:751251-Hanusia_phi.AAC.4